MWRRHDHHYYTPHITLLHYMAHTTYTNFVFCNYTIPCNQMMFLTKLKIHRLSITLAYLNSQLYEIDNTFHRIIYTIRGLSSIYCKKHHNIQKRMCVCVRVRACGFYIHILNMQQHFDV